MCCWLSLSCNLGYQKSTACVLHMLVSDGGAGVELLLGQHRPKRWNPQNQHRPCQWRNRPLRHPHAGRRAVHGSGQEGVWQRSRHNCHSVSGLHTSRLQQIATPWGSCCLPPQILSCLHRRRGRQWDKTSFWRPLQLSQVIQIKNFNHISAN